MKTVLSAIQPTGYMHLGNYFGAVSNWVKLQESYKCFYGVVDYHAMTMPFDIKKLRNNTWELITNLMACGVKSENLFIQSMVPEHTELAWILQCYASYGQAMRMTQFKDKSTDRDTGKDDFVSVGLFTYPVLQAADILIYRADYVPIGKDQEQHLELTRDIAQRFNHLVGKEYFVMPEPLYTETPKIRSTADPSKKMSKSAGEKHYINLFADEETLRRQIKSAVTDTGEKGDTMSEGVENLFLLIKASGNSDGYQVLMDAYNSENLKYSELKQVTADSLWSMMKPIQEHKKEINEDKKRIKDQIKESSAEIRKVAQETLREVKDLVGLLQTR
ncbi:MAG: tryptophan--tRNA ligase [Saprospiraceae bacterium]|nr:tryptophan--tRNA ligase [Saprospiraceae bacterium]